MKKKSILILLALTVMLPAITLAGFKLIPIKQFDGVWFSDDSQTTLLITETKNRVMIYGKDNTSAWSAKGVKNGNALTFKGKGHTLEGTPFDFKGSLLKNENSSELNFKDWSANNVSVKNKGILKPLKYSNSDNNVNSDSRSR